MRLSGIAAVLAVGFAVVAAGGCYAEYHAEVEYLPPPEGPVVQEAPPQPRAEQIPAPPWEGAIWVDGYWSWAGGRYVWVSGRYMRPPRAGVVWYHGGYVQVDGGWVWVAGRWAAPGYDVGYRYFYAPRWRRHWWYSRHRRAFKPRARRYRRGRYRRGRYRRGRYHQRRQRHHRHHRPRYHDERRHRRGRCPDGSRPPCGVRSDVRRHGGSRVGPRGRPRRHRAPPSRDDRRRRR